MYTVYICVEVYTVPRPRHSRVKGGCYKALIVRKHRCNGQVYMKTLKQAIKSIRGRRSPFSTRHTNLAT